MYQTGNGWGAVPWLAAVACLICAASAGASDWPMQGADAGMTKYSPDSIPANSSLQLSYRKRFYTDFRNYTGNYYYGNSVVVRDGQAVLFCNDQDDPARIAALRGVKFTKFNWATGQRLAQYNSPFYWEEHAREVDSHHFTNPLVWHTDNRIYGRRGGDLNSIWALNMATETWTEVPDFLPPDGSAWDGDASAFLRIYGDNLIYRFGYTESSVPYAAYDISAAAWANGTQGAYKRSIGPWGNAKHYYYGDVPKIARNVVVVAQCDVPGVTLVACNLNTGARWTRSFASDMGGAMGFHAGVSDYWRFVASEEGYYAFFTRAGTWPTVQPTIRVLDVETGADRWSYVLTDAWERPLLACHNGVLYVIGRAQQLKMSLADGSILWEQHHSFPGDYGYIHANYEWAGQSLYSSTSDPLYRPMVLTDDTLWFVDGQSRGVGTLVGLRTSDGSIIQRTNLASLYSGTESLDYVNDLMTADGKLGLLVSVSDTNDPHHVVAFCQDLYVYRTMPANTALITASAGAGGTIDPAGEVFVPTGTSQTFHITANDGFVIGDVLVDGASVGKVASYTFQNITANHTISASFEPQALVGWWKLDDGTGTSAADASGQANPATLTNGPAWTTGILGGGLSLDGTDDYLLAAQDMTGLFPTTSVTIALWFKAAAGGVLVSELGEPTVNAAWNTSQIEVLDDGEVKGRVWGLTSLSLGRVGFGTWHHVALRYNQTTRTLDGFLDGVRSTGTATGDRQMPGSSSYALHYALGAAAPVHLGNGHYLAGSIDDVRIYNGAMPAEDLTALAQSGPATCTLTATILGPGSGTVTLDPPGGTYPAGQVVTVTATPSAHCTFFRWGGDLSGPASSATIVMNADRAVTAAFEWLPLTGDINGDRYVNVGDLQLLVAVWGGDPNYANWRWAADLNNDRVINVGDLQVLVAHWAEHYQDGFQVSSPTNTHDDWILGGCPPILVRE